MLFRSGGAKRHPNSLYIDMNNHFAQNEDSNVHNQEPGYVKNEVKMRWEEMGLKNSGIKDVESIRGKELVHNFSSEGSLAQRINGKTLRWAVASNEMALARYQLENEVCPNLLHLSIYLWRCIIALRKGI